MRFLIALSLSLLALFLFLFNSIKTINEGYVGVCYSYGKLTDIILEPGLQFVWLFWFPFDYIGPFPVHKYITSVHEIQITIQTDSIINVPCGTSSGINIIFPIIEVVNQLQKEYVYETVKNYGVNYDDPLIFKKINHEMLQYCSNNTLQQVFIDNFPVLDEFLIKTLQESINTNAKGVTIRSIRLSKPQIPKEFDDIFKTLAIKQAEIRKGLTEQERELQIIDMENKKAIERLNANQNQTIVRLEADRRNKLAEIESNKTLELAHIQALLEKEVARIEADKTKKIGEINSQIAINNKTFEQNILSKKFQYENQIKENEIYMLKHKGQSDAEYYANMKHAEYQKQLLTKEYVMLETSRNLANNTKIYYGNSLPKFLQPAFFNFSDAL